MFDVGSSGSWERSPTAYGGSSMENVFLVNGVNTTNPRGAAFGSLVKVNYNAVEEVRVVALGSKAEYGSFSGAAIDVLTKSGSNKLHGNLAYYTELRGGFFKENYPVTQVGDPNVPLPAPDNWLFYLRRRQAGRQDAEELEGNFTIGGPIIKDKIWFYGAFDYLRSASMPVNWDLQNTYLGRYADLKISAEPFAKARAWISYHYESNRGAGWSWGHPTGLGYQHDLRRRQQEQYALGPVPVAADRLDRRHGQISGLLELNDQPFVPDDAPANCRLHQLVEVGPFLRDRGRLPLCRGSEIHPPDVPGRRVDLRRRLPGRARHQVRRPVHQGTRQLDGRLLPELCQLHVSARRLVGLLRRAGLCPLGPSDPDLV